MLTLLGSIFGTRRDCLNWIWSCALCRNEGDEDDTPETKAERERLRRQANNARER